MISYYDNRIKYRYKDIDKHQKTRDQKLKKVENMTNLLDSYEVYQWSFDSENTPTPIYTGVVGIRDNGELLDKSMKMPLMFEKTYSDGYSGNLALHFIFDDNFKQQW